MKKYYFRVDGGNIYSIATGHIKRCLKLARHISQKDDGAEICFIMKDYKEGLDLVAEDYKVIVLDRNTDLNAEKDLMRDLPSEGFYFICDIRNIDNEYIDIVRKKSLKFVLFDDLGIENIRPDILINPTPFCYLEYKGNKYPETTMLLGERFFIIDGFFIDRQRIRDFKKKRYNIIASFGGADFLNITEFFIRNVAPKLMPHNISIVLGPAYAKTRQITGKYKNIRFHTGASSLTSLFADNDIAFVCGGDTAVESCANGLATFIISSIYYEKKVGESLHERKMAYFIADIEDIKNSNFNERYIGILKNRNGFLMTLSENGAGLVDKEGAERIHKVLLGEGR